MTTRVILVRHGQSTYNAQKRFQGCCDDSVLTEKGRITAYQTGVALCHIAFDAIYTSPLQRTQETAQKILAASAAFTEQSPKLHTHANLKEIDLPIWQGKTFQYVREQLAQTYRIWKERPHEFQMVAAPMQQEVLAGHLAVTTEPQAVVTQDDSNLKSAVFPVQDLYRQAKQFWQEILPNHQGKTILIVSHGGTIRALISTALGIDIHQFHALQQSNCGISVLHVERTSQAQLEALNLTDHLGEVLPKLKEGKQGLRLLLLPAEDLSPVSKQHLAESLKSIALDFCLTIDSETAQATADCLLNHSPPIVHLQVSGQNFWQHWHQTAQARMLNCTSLSTGLVIGERNAIATALHQILALPENKISLNLKPGTFSVLHYPNSTARPVLQALNMTGGLNIL